MTVNQPSEEEITHLQQQEQQLQQTLLQRQTMQAQLLETENALDTLGKTKEKPFKMIGPLLIAFDRKELIEELTSKKEMLAIRLKNIEQQEEQLRKSFQELQEKLLQRLHS